MRPCRRRRQIPIPKRLLVHRVGQGTGERETAQKKPIEYELVEEVTQRRRVCL